jgi:hypothetical protein
MSKFTITVVAEAVVTQTVEIEASSFEEAGRSVMKSLRSSSEESGWTIDGVIQARPFRAFESEPQIKYLEAYVKG